MTPGVAPSRPSPRAWFALVTVCVIWGTTYLAIKVALDTIPPFLMGGLRYTTAGLMLAGILYLNGQTIPGPRDWGRLAIVGFFMLVFGNGGVVVGSQWLPSGLTAVLIATSPFWMVSVEAAVSRSQQLSARDWIGLVTGFAGIIILVWPDIMSGGSAGAMFLWGVVAVQLACAGWAVGSAYTRRHVMPADILGAAAAQMTFGGLFMLIIGTVLGEWPRLSFSTTTAISFVYLTLAGSLVAYAAYSYALRHMDVAIVSLYTYVNPIIAVILGTLILDEPFHARMIVAAAVILAGMWIVGKK